MLAWNLEPIDEIRSSPLEPVESENPSEHSPQEVTDFFQVGISFPKSHVKTPGSKNRRYRKSGPTKNNSNHKNSRKTKDAMIYTHENMEEISEKNKSHPIGIIPSLSECRLGTDSSKTTSELDVPCHASTATDLTTRDHYSGAFIPP